MRTEQLALLRRRGTAVSAAVAGTVAVALGAAASLAAAAPFVAAAAHGPDLLLASASRAPSVQLAPGASFSERFVEKNIGSKPAGASATGLYLSPTATVGHGAIRLAPTIPVGALSPGQKINRSAKLAIPATMRPGAYFLIGCADIAHKVAELSEANNCRTASGHVRVACRATDSPALTSPNKYCFDGDAADGIFVSPAGNDSNPGTMAAPKQTLAAAVAAATAVDEDVYVAKGTYEETLEVANGVSVLGGYDASWQRSPKNVTTITGDIPSGESVAAVALNITKPTTLQLVTLSPSASGYSSASSIGLRGSGSTALVLDHDTVLAAAGTTGASGANGTHGEDGHDGQVGGDHANAPENQAKGGLGGTSPLGRVGGDGGDGGLQGSGGGTGQPGQLSSPDAQGRMGGPGGAGGAGDSESTGQDGDAGDSGSFVGDGSGAGPGAACGAFWCSAAGQDGASGTAGHGGGGGGGGGSESGGYGGAGGGGGAGGEGGGGGAGGESGGGSFGVFLVNSAGAVVRDSTVTASGGGDGGAGGGGAYGGAGGGGAFGGVYTGASGDGGTGGNGGEGGRGGDGGGGAGGPSVGIYGLTAADAPGTIVHVAEGGAGGAGGQGSGDGGGAGAPGVAEAFLGGA